MTRFLRRWLAPAAVAALAVGVAACNKPQPKSTATGGTSVPGVAVNVGSPLYAPAPMPSLTAVGATAEPIVATQGVVRFDETVTISAEVDGKLELVAYPLDPKLSYDVNDPRYAGRLVPHPRLPEWKFFRLVDGDPIRKGQVLAMLDNSQAELDVRALTTSKKAAKDAYEATGKAAGKYAEMNKIVSETGTVREKIESLVNWLNAQATQERLNTDYVKYSGDLDKAIDRKERHILRTDFDGKIVHVLKPRGSVVKAGEPILEVQNTARLRVEAKLDGAQADKLKLYMTVAVEPVRELSAADFTARHLQDVAGVAVFVSPGSNGRPVIVSGSGDGKAIVWDATGPKSLQHVLPHPSGVGVKSVAATAKGEQRFVVTGGSDGKVRLWDVSDLTRLPAEPTALLEESHAAAVSAAAFSPDGKFLATASGREVMVWDVDARKKKYTLPADHRDDVKALQFTLQGTLVTVCRDKAIRVWTLGTETANVARTLDYRSGSVDVLGVSADGTRVLFDQDATRVDLVSLADGNSTASLVNAGSGVRFSGQALFSPDGELVLTGAGDTEGKGELQVWSAPLSGRGAERRRLVTTGRTAVTCAAFSPDPKVPFVAVGTQSGVVHFWTLPPIAKQTPLTGKLVSITRTDSRSATIRVEVENPGGKWDDLLQDKGVATLIIDPLDKPTPPPLPAPGPAPMPGVPSALK